jgi:hypothetical protein
VEGRVVLQMDKTTPQNKIVLGYFYQCSKTQVYIAFITYTLVAMIKNQLKTEMSTYEMLQILSVSLFDKTQLTQLFQRPIYQNIKEQDCNQLKMNLF